MCLDVRQRLLESCGPRVTTRVVNGLDAKPHSWPWQWSPIFVTFGVTNCSVTSVCVDNLQPSLMPRMDHGTCSKPDWWGLALRATMVFDGGDGSVAGWNPFSPPVLFGDSGGLLNRKNPEGLWEVHGTARLCLVCNYENKPTVFTFISNFNDWIDQAMISN
ncbi:chymotrypsin-like elastase family member 2A [Oncorhynchus clarkii lewisi]|uniref:chymotrypsin-like elastase family member 2A n=1 Tax=Oncorhynchus clarkii lewisi TaxID=490388 RepID=UPI0039B9720F